MRILLLTLTIILGFGFAGLPEASAAPFPKDAQHAANGPTLRQAQYGGYCARLRHACIYKEERGEVGRGNCHRYRVECGQQRHCEELRRSCVYKYERGEVGQGNCRRYRHECGAW